jgi:hypothetical protein
MTCPAQWSGGVVCLFSWHYRPSALRKALRGPVSFRICVEYRGRSWAKAIRQVTYIDIFLCCMTERSHDAFVSSFQSYKQVSAIQCSHPHNSCHDMYAFEAFPLRPFKAFLKHLFNNVGYIPQIIPAEEGSNL